MNELDLFKADTETFIKELGGPNQAKVADAAGLFIAQKLRERSFARQVLTPRQVTRYDLQVSEDHDQLIFMDEKEVPTAPSVAINFKAEPDAQYVTTPRYPIAIFEIASPLYAKKEIELLASTQPVTKIIEENTVRDIEEVEDTYFLNYADSAAAGATGGTNIINYDTTTGGALSKGALKVLLNQILRNRLKCSTVLMSAITFNDFLTMTYLDLGSDLLKEVTIEGYKYYNFGGVKIIVSIKDTLFQDPTTGVNGQAISPTNPAAHMLYGFADEKALGRFLVLDQTKFGVRKIFNTIEWMGWEYIGLGFGNSNGIARVSMIDSTLPGGSYAQYAPLNTQYAREGNTAASGDVIPAAPAIVMDTQV